MAVAVTAIAILAACGTTTKVEPARPSFSYDQAKTLVHQSIGDVVAALTPRPELTDPTAGDQPCSGPNDDQRTDTVMYEQVYWLRSIPRSRTAAIVNQIRSYWQSHGYVLDVNDVKTSPGAVWTLVASDSTTGFRMKVVKATTGDLSLGAQSPCVREPKPKQT